MNERQINVLNPMLDGWGEEFVDGINASKYGSLGRVSKAISTRELADLVDKGCLYKFPGGGWSTRYTLCAATHADNRDRERPSTRNTPYRQAPNIE